jgi:CRP-like cAMP-binding protein
MAQSTESLETRDRSLTGYSPWQQRRLASLATTVSVPAGRVLCRNGGSDRQFIIIVEGEATVSADGANPVRLGPGCGFGALRLPTADGPRGADVAAATHATLLVLHRGEFRTLVEDLPSVVWRVHQATAERLAGEVPRIPADRVAVEVTRRSAGSDGAGVISNSSGSSMSDRTLTGRPRVLDGGYE